MREMIINKNDAGQRADKFLQKALPELPKTLMYKYLRLKRIKLNGKRLNISDILKENDVLSLYINDEFFGMANKKDQHMELLKKVSTELDIVYEDENIIIAFKPVGMEVHRGYGASGDTLADIIGAYLYRRGEYAPEQENSFSPAVCNRLDRNTCGLVIAAKNSAALREVNKNIRERRIHKKYLCVCVGKLPLSHKTETAYHKKGQHNLVSIRKDYAEGYKKIITEYTVLEEKNGLNLVEISLITGRTHQIRAHMAFLGAPILGDGKYGNIKANKRYGIFRQQLCAYSLEFDVDVDSMLSYLNGKVFKSAQTGIMWR